MHLMIVEDREEDRLRLAELIQNDCARHREAVDFSFFESAEAFLDRYRPGTCDGLFLDVLLGGLNGIEAARKIRETEPRLPIVFTTRERDFALEGFDVRAADYLLKPLTAEKAARCMERIREFQARPASLPLSETSAWGHAATVDVPFEEILYARYANHIMDVHTTLGVLCARQSFRSFTAQLPHTGRFCVCGRGLVVNLAQVVRLLDCALLLTSGERLPIPHRRWREVQQAYTDWAFTSARKGGLA